MKKLILVVLIIGFVLSLTGATCLKQVQDKVCSPPPEVMAVVNAVAPAVGLIIATAVPGSASFVTAVANQQTITAIQGGVCVSVTQLNNLIAFIQGLNQAKAGVKAFKPYDADALIEWRDKSK